MEVKTIDQYGSHLVNRSGTDNARLCRTVRLTAKQLPTAAKYPGTLRVTDNSTSTPCPVESMGLGDWGRVPGR